MFYSLTFQKIVLFAAIGLIIGGLIGFAGVLGFDLDGSIFIISVLLSMLLVFAAAMFAELYHIREAINRSRNR
ncbi:hypothetical protein AAV35_012015 [Salimicrobium jeotgali]|uniref:Uncharacterized protein n=2 Tax=Salimicrobium TaxID=351195 RepID=K2FJ93_9BACI|nr:MULTISPECIES: hypothetical protein [Salimicrobium]AKG05418.1 hypothetical protein AAV35_012015 [Salimicrobium jeotgali]EKE31116.1 hypothetical protein MJ3_09812 [Salimicrobium jeotgali]MBM7697277.1 uncharacterized protein YacL [Salimicrobium jeotgali]PBB06020.1 hypothetical protein CKW00_05905 [Salimicrobium humidisoli]